MEGILARGQELVAAFGIRAATALLILVVGRWVAKFLQFDAEEIRIPVPQRDVHLHQA
jgi:hypothetical protein